MNENRGVAEVYMAVHKATKRIVAVKKMNSDHKALTMSSLINEIFIMKTCRHENIVDFFDTYRVGGKQIWVVMEYMKLGSLTDVLEQFEHVQLQHRVLNFQYPLQNCLLSVSNLGIRN